MRAILRMTLVPSGSGFVDPHSPLRGASLAQSGMADPDPCIPLSARSATGIPRFDEEPLPQDCDEEEGLILEDNSCPGDLRTTRGDPGRAYPFMVTRTGCEESAVSPEQSPAWPSAASGVNLGVHVGAWQNPSRLLFLSVGRSPHFPDAYS